MRPIARVEIQTTVLRSFVLCIGAVAAISGWLPSPTRAQEEAASSGQAQAGDEKKQAAEEQKFPELDLPQTKEIETLQKFVQQAKQTKPTSIAHYKAMQSAIRDASKKLLDVLAGKAESPAYKQAEIDTIASSVALMTYFSEAEQKKVIEQIESFLKGRETLSIQDVQTGMMAAAMLELQPNKRPSRNIYALLDELLKEDKREEMQSLRVNLQASVRRLELLGNKLELLATDRAGKKIDIDDYAGKFVIVDFFATWCGPCMAEVPRLKNYYEKYKDRGLEVIGVSLDQEVENLEAFLERSEVPWPIIHDINDDPMKTLQMKFGISTLPAVMLLNKEGTVVSLEARGSELDRLMQMLFEAPTPAAKPVDEKQENTAPKQAGE